MSCVLLSFSSFFFDPAALVLSFVYTLTSQCDAGSFNTMLWPPFKCVIDHVCLLFLYSGCGACTEIETERIWAYRLKMERRAWLGNSRFIWSTKIYTTETALSSDRTTNFQQWGVENDMHNLQRGASLDCFVIANPRQFLWNKITFSARIARQMVGMTANN